MKQNTSLHGLLSAASCAAAALVSIAAQAQSPTGPVPEPQPVAGPSPTAAASEEEVGTPETQASPKRGRWVQSRYGEVWVAGLAEPAPAESEPSSDAPASAGPKRAPRPLGVVHASSSTAADLTARSSARQSGEPKSSGQELYAGGVALTVIGSLGVATGLFGMVGYGFVCVTVAVGTALTQSSAGCNEDPLTAMKVVAALGAAVDLVGLPMLIVGAVQMADAKAEPKALLAPELRLGLGRVEASWSF